VQKNGFSPKLKDSNEIKLLKKKLSSQTCVSVFMRLERMFKTKGFTANVALEFLNKIINCFKNVPNNQT
jgi:hypothetical protein